MSISEIGKRLGAIAAAPLLVAVYLMRPLLRIELCIVGAHRFGHLALEPEIRLCLEQFGGTSGRQRRITFWSFGRKSSQSNRLLAQLWVREVRFSSSTLVGAIVQSGELFPKFAIPRANLSIFGPKNVLDLTTSRLANQVGGLRSNICNQLGLTPDRYVCLVIRDGTYYRQTGLHESPGYKLLNFDAETFRATCRRLVSEGLKVVRLGTPTENRLIDESGVVDYANSPLRSELNDLILVRDCTFLVSTQTGPDALGLALRKPTLFVDTLRVSQFFLGTQLATWNPVGYLDPNSGRKLSLSELIDSQLLWLKNPDEFVDSKYEFLRSTGLEISEMASAYHHDLRNGVSPEIASLRDEVNHRLTVGLGERGRSIWGDVVANVNSWWLKTNSEWFIA